MLLGSSLKSKALEGLGWTGNILFALSAMPQAYMSWDQGHSNGLSAGLLSMWFFGELFSMIYGYAKKMPAPVLMNYAVNFVCLCVIVWYYLFPKV